MSVNSSKVIAFAQAVVNRITGLISTHNSSSSAHSSLFNSKQDTLVSGTSIKTINNHSLLGAGNISIQGGDGVSLACVSNFYVDTATDELVLEVCTGKLVDSVSKSTSGLVDTYTITFSDNSTYVFTVTNGSDGSSPDIVTSTNGWNSTTSDSKVPSEKLTKASLDNKLDKVLGTANRFVVTDSSKNVTLKEKLGNITLDGKVGSNADYFLYTTTSGAVTSKQKIGNITTSGAIGSTSGKPIITTTSGVLTTGSFGTSSGTFAEGNHTHSGYVSATKVISWSSTPSDNNVPSEKLVSDTFDAIEDLIGDAITYINQ